MGKEATVMSTEQGHRSGLLDACPGCGSDRLSLVYDGYDTNFFCESCGACWFVSMGWVSRVNPLTCPACSSQSECLARLEVRTKAAPGAGAH